MKNRYPIRFSNLKENKMENKYVKGHYRICKFIAGQNKKGISVTDLDISKATKLGRQTVLIYRTKLLRDRVIIRSGSDFRLGRKRATWKCIKSIKKPLELIKSNKVKTKKVKPQIQTSDFQKGMQLLHQLLKLVEKAIS